MKYNIADRPICQKARCPRYREPLMVHGIYHPSNGRRLKQNGTYPTSRILRFICQPKKPPKTGSHYVYQGPDGELADRIRGITAKFDTRPKCQEQGCPRYGQHLGRGKTSVFRTGAGDVRITLFVCRLGKSRPPHYAYQGPRGEVAIRVSPGRFRFTHGVTGQIVETEPNTNPDQPKLVAAANCKAWGDPKRRKRRIRKIRVALAKPKVRKLRSEASKALWAERKAEIVRLRELAAAAPAPKEKRRPGRKPGITRDRIIEAETLDNLIAQDPHKRGAVKRAAFKVYPDVPKDLAPDRARQTLKDWRRAGRPSSVREIAS